MNNPLSMTDPRGFSWLSKALSLMGRLFHNVEFRAILAVAVAIFAPYLFPALHGLLSAMTVGAIAGGIAAGNLKGVLVGAVST